MKTLLAAFAVFIATSVPPGHAAPPASPGAAATAPAPRPPALEISVPTAALPVPALHYRLIPGLAERTRGDAAPLYLSAFLHAHLTDDEQKQIDELLAAPGGTFSVEQATRILQPRQQYLATLELAARRGDCQWEIPWREQGFATMLPHLQPCRQAVRLLSLQVRLQIKQRRFDDALHTLQTGFSLVDHLKNDATLIQGLVAIAMTHVLLDRVAELQQTPGSPNLYWALAGLPHPLVDMQAMAERERALLALAPLPELKGRSFRELSAEEFSAVPARIEHLSKAFNILEPAVGKKFAVTATIVQQLAPARAWLLSHGYTEKEVNDLQPISAVGMYLLEIYQQTADDLYKWTSLPYWQAREGLAKSEGMLRKLQEQGPNPALALLPAIKKVVERVAATDRRVALLQTVEALRGYAAAHDGKLPASLSDLTETPAPIDPMTGKAFEYEVTGNMAVLRSLTRVEHVLGEEGIYQIKMTARSTP